jgi:hypothetical protein
MDVLARIAQGRVPTRNNSGSRPFACDAGSRGRDTLLRDPALHVSIAFSLLRCESARRWLAPGAVNSRTFGVKRSALIAVPPAFERLERAPETLVRETPARED